MPTSSRSERRNGRLDETARLSAKESRRETPAILVLELVASVAWHWPPRPTHARGSWRRHSCTASSRFLSLPGLVLFSLYVLGILPRCSWVGRYSGRAPREPPPLTCGAATVPGSSWRSVLITVRDRAGSSSRKAGTVIRRSRSSSGSASFQELGGPASREHGSSGARMAPHEPRRNGSVGRRSAKRAEATQLENEIAGVLPARLLCGTGGPSHRAGHCAARLRLEASASRFSPPLPRVKSWFRRWRPSTTWGTRTDVGFPAGEAAPRREPARAGLLPAHGGEPHRVCFVLACQCMSTVAVVRRETNSWHGRSSWS